MNQLLDEFAQTLLVLPVLECVMLVSKGNGYEWYWSEAFQAALEDRLKLPTVKEIHLECGHDFPLSILDNLNCKNIKNLTLAEDVLVEGLFCDPVLPRLKSLTLSIPFIASSSLLTWVKLHIKQLQSLECAMSSIELLPELLEACSGTLKTLELDLGLSFCKIPFLSDGDTATLKYQTLQNIITTPETFE
jgi:hypothetical protein